MPVELRDEVSIATSDLGSVLLDERSGKYWQLNRSGALILDVLLQGRSLADAAQAVVERYRVDRERADADAKALLEQLRAGGLVS
ncbi:lasso peptide biosynthesis PqqD family chaperone [Streptomyces sp. NPDC017529]|uniref:lasso peptide biosynthesis PqqD family chaperone n=1 Tax=Streptomyces sp. NPDC017529 TaxID=3365000 RepID=UPI0037B317B9